MSREPVKAKLVDELFFHYEDMDTECSSPGSFKFRRDTQTTITGLNFICPCGCGDVLAISFVSKTGPAWQWDGNEQEPTVTPSIRRIGGCEWHGFLTKGVFLSC